MLRTGPGNADDIRFLKGIVADEMRWHLAGEHHHGYRVHVRGCDAGDGIRGTWSRSDETHTNLAGCTGIPVCSVYCPLFMSGQDKLYVFGVHDGIKDVQNSTARITKNMSDPFTPQCFYECICA